MIGLVTYEKHPDLTDDDRPLLGELAALGLEAAPVVWDRPRLNWNAFSTLVLRSCWNYHTRPREFTAWLLEMQRRGIPLWNPVELVRWNMHKRYLRDLDRKGVLVPPTEWVARGDPRPLPTLLRERGWHDVIVKPAISASATDTWRTAGTRHEDDSRFRELVDRRDVLVQPVIGDVITRGEWSLIYIDGRFSHAMLKRPRSGDFRVQAELGGTAERAEPPAEVIAAGDRAVRCMRGDWIYARVDGVVTAEGFVLMELEAIEPLLFLAQASGAHRALARAIESRVGDRVGR